MKDSAWWEVALMVGVGIGWVIVSVAPIALTAWIVVKVLQWMGVL